MNNKDNYNNPWIIKTLWIGDSLSMIEQLCLNSFIHCGHNVELFVYSDVKNIPDAVKLRDGNEILHEDNIFMYKSRPSYSGFANWFRYEMLLKEGGVWVDTDVICLKHFNFETDLFFGYEDCTQYNCAVVGANPNQEIFKFLSQQVQSPNEILPYDTKKDKRMKFKRKYFKGNERGNVQWGETGPVGFTRAINHFGLSNKALPFNIFYPIHYDCWKSIFDGTFDSVDRFFPDSYGIHLWNEMMAREPNFNKNGSFAENTLIEFLKKKYL